MSPSPLTPKIASSRPQEMISAEEEQELYRKLALNGNLSDKEIDVLIHRNERKAEEHRNIRKQLHREFPMLKRRKTVTIATDIHKHHKGIISEKEERVLMNRLTSGGKLSGDEMDALTNRNICIAEATRRRHEAFMARWREEQEKSKAYWRMVESSKQTYKEAKQALEKSKREWQELQKELEEGIRSKKKFDEDIARFWKKEEEYEKRCEQSRKHYLH